MIKVKLFTISENEKEVAAVLGEHDRLYPIRQFFENCNTVNDLIERNTLSEIFEFSASVKSGESLEGKESYDFKEVTLLAPIPVPKQDVVCVGVNYDEHMSETKDVIDFSQKQATVYFSKRVNEAVGDGGMIRNYDFVDSLDYEVELCMIIGEDTKNVSSKNALENVFGYTIMNDFSARNLQMQHVQWYLGKSLDTYTAIGPCIVTADELDHVDHLNLTCKVNGEIRQSSNTSYMIQPVDKIIEELSRGMTLKKGTLIATGTPGGVGMSMKPPGYLKSGDTVTCEIEYIGTLTNICE